MTRDDEGRPAAELRATEVDLAGLLRVLGHNLYSTPDVALRELVQNAHDSCVRRRIETGEAFEPTILLDPQPGSRRLVIQDTGAGMTREEIIRYLATVGSGATREFREEPGGEDLIGCFGLGFLSAFFVSERVEVITTSHRAPDEGWRFVSRGGQRYELMPCEPREVGTSVTLDLNQDHSHLADPDIVERLVRRYCCLLPIEVRLASSPGTPINRPVPPWRLEHEALGSVELRRACLELASRFDPVFEPLCTFPVGWEEGGPARGILWIQDGGSYATSDNRAVSVFVRGMLVSSDARDLLPRWAGFAGCAIEADGLTPTASREDLQEGPEHARVAEALAEALVRGISELPRREPAAWRRVLARHEEALRGAALCDQRLMDMLADAIRVPTSEGDLTVSAIKERCDGSVPVALGDGRGPEEILFRALRQPIVNGSRYAALAFCSEHVRKRGGRLVQLGTDDGDRHVFRPAAISDEARASLVAGLGSEGVEVLASRFDPPELPLLVVPDREAELKARIESDEADRRISSALLGLARLRSAELDGRILARVHVNLDSPLVQGLLARPAAQREPALRVLRAIAELAGGTADDGWSRDVASSMTALSTALLEILDARREN